MSSSIEKKISTCRNNELNEDAVVVVKYQSMEKVTANCSKEWNHILCTLIELLKVNKIFIKL